MLHLTLAYVQQADLEREIEAYLQNRQILRSTPRTLAPIEPPVATVRAPRRGPVRVRAAVH